MGADTSDTGRVDLWVGKLKFGFRSSSKGCGMVVDTPQCGFMKVI